MKGYLVEGVLPDDLDGNFLPRAALRQSDLPAGPLAKYLPQCVGPYPPRGNEDGGGGGRHGRGRAVGDWEVQRGEASRHIYE